MHLFTDFKAALKEAVMRPSERLSPYEFISKSGNGRDLVAFVTRSGREAVNPVQRVRFGSRDLIGKVPLSVLSRMLENNQITRRDKAEKDTAIPAMLVRV